jgi:hypothetical protein
MVVRMPRTTRARALAIWLAAMALWMILSVWGATGTWQGGLAGLAAAAALGSLLGPLVRLSWQRQVSRPAPGRGLEGWAVRHLWLSTPLIWAVYLAPVLGIDLAVAGYSHGFPAGGIVVITFSGWFLVATGFAAFWNLVLRQQRGRIPAAAVA